MLRRTRIVIVAVIILSTILAALSISPEGQFRLQLFEIGFKHGVEDRQSGVTYGTESPFWKVVRNGSSWTQSDKLLVQHLAASTPIEMNDDLSIFMIGYRWGYRQWQYWTVILSIVVLIVVVVRRWVFTKGSRLP